MSEKLSALIDNELDELERARVLREVSDSGELIEQWSRYHLIGRAMRREAVMLAGDLPARVARALEKGAGANGELPDTGRPPSQYRGAGRLAIAASVAGVLLVGGLIVKLYTDSGPAGTSMPAAQQLAVSNDALHWEGADPRSEDALNTLLIEHGEFTSASGMNGLTAYTKFVASDSR